MDSFERDDYCFACGSGNPIGLKLSFDLIPDGAISRATLPREYQGFNNVIHGGIVATLLDEAMAHAVHRHVGEAVTTSLNIKLRQALMVGEDVKIESRITDKNRRAVRAQAEIRSMRTDKVIASADSQFILVSNSLRENNV